MKTIITLLLGLSFLWSVSFNNYAEDFSFKNWQWHGFAAQGVIDVDGSDFVNDNGKPSLALTELGLNTSVDLLDNLRLAGQVVYLNGGNRYHKGTRVDYLLLDWRILNTDNWQGNLYLGRFKNVHWLYSSTRDVPFARPTIILPQSVYYDGFRDIAVGADGSALKLSHSSDRWGDVDINLSYGTSPISKEQGKLVLSDAVSGRFKQDFDAQLSVYWRPQFSAWRFGVSLLNSDFSYKKSPTDFFFDATFSFQFYTLNWLYEGEKWEFSGEVHQNRFITDGFYQDDFLRANFGVGTYLQSRYQVNNNLSLIARLERFYANKDDKSGKKLFSQSQGQIPTYFAFQHDAMLGLSYDISSNMKIRFEQHWIDGTARLTPVLLPNPVINNQRHWQITAMQFMVWF